MLNDHEALSLFWNLKRTDGRFQRLWTTDVTKPYFCTFSLSDGCANYQETIQRYIMAPGVKRMVIKVN